MKSKLSPMSWKSARMEVMLFNNLIALIDLHSTYVSWLLSTSSIFFLFHMLWLLLLVLFVYYYCKNMLTFLI